MAFCKYCGAQLEDGQECTCARSQEAKQAEQAAQPVSAWAEDVWRAASAGGLFDGTAPRTALTREQAALVLSRLKRQGG